MINALPSVVMARLIETDSTRHLDPAEREREEREKARLDESSCEHHLNPPDK
jgi:hypothetical protein